MDFVFDWDTEGDRFSFDDSDRFDEDSLCSWISEPESLCQNWRGWKRQNGGQQPSTLIKGQGECRESLGFVYSLNFYINMHKTNLISTLLDNKYID